MHFFGLFFGLLVVQVSIDTKAVFSLLLLPSIELFKIIIFHGINHDGCLMAKLRTLVLDTAEFMLFIQFET